MRSVVIMILMKQETKFINEIKAESDILDQQYDGHIIDQKYSISYKRLDNSFLYDAPSGNEYWYPDKEILLKSANVNMEKNFDGHAGSIILKNPVEKLSQEQILKEVGMDYEIEHFDSSFKVFSTTETKYKKITHVKTIDENKDHRLILVEKEENSEDDISLLAIVNIENSGSYIFEYLCDMSIAFFINGEMIIETTSSTQWQHMPLSLTSGKIFFEIRQKHNESTEGFGFQLKDMNDNIVISSVNINDLIIPPYICPNGFIPDVAPFTNNESQTNDTCLCRNKNYEFNLKVLQSILDNEKFKTCINGNSVESSWTTKLNLKTKIIMSREDINGGASLLEYHNMVMNVIQMIYDILVNGLNVDILITNPILILKTCRKYGVYANIEGQKICHDVCNAESVIRQITKQLLTIIDL